MSLSNMTTQDLHEEWIALCKQVSELSKVNPRRRLVKRLKKKTLLIRMELARRANLEYFK